MRSVIVPEVFMIAWIPDSESSHTWDLTFDIVRHVQTPHDRGNGENIFQGYTTEGRGEKEGYYIWQDRSSTELHRHETSRWHRAHWRPSIRQECGGGGLFRTALFFSQMGSLLCCSDHEPRNMYISLTSCVHVIHHSANCYALPICFFMHHFLSTILFHLRPSYSHALCRATH